MFLPENYCYTVPFYLQLYFYLDIIKINFRSDKAEYKPSGNQTNISHFALVRRLLECTTSYNHSSYNYLDSYPAKVAYPSYKSFFVCSAELKWVLSHQLWDALSHNQILLAIITSHLKYLVSRPTVIFTSKEWWVKAWHFTADKETKYMIPRLA